MAGNATNQQVTVGAAIRTARLESHLTQGELGARIGYSASAVSRIECGQPVHMHTLRAIVAALGAPPERFGLASNTPDTPGHSRERAPVATLNAIPRKGGPEVIERRGLLAGIVATVSAASIPQLERALFSGAAPKALPGTLTASLNAAQADYRAARYEALSARLPALVSAAQQLPTTGLARDHAKRCSPIPSPLPASGVRRYTTTRSLGCAQIAP